MNRASINELQDTALALLKQLIAIPSFSKEEHGTAQLIQNVLQSNGITPDRLMNNVWARNQHFDPAKPTLLLNSHHDTVKPNSSYTKNPFLAIEEDGKLYGLGSNDAGGCLVSLLACFIYFHAQKDLKYNLIFAATAEEEISGANGVEALLPALGKIDTAIVGEPTLLELAASEKGLLVIDCTVHGRSGHAARNEGDNAIYKSLPDIAWFQNYKFPKVSDLLGPVTMNVTMIQSGMQHNVVPDKCDFTVDIRINDSYTHEEILNIIKEHVACTVTPRSIRLRSTSVPEKNPVLEAAVRSGIKVFGSATLSDKSLMPFPAIKIGPGSSSRSHTADEFVYVQEIKDGIDTYIKLLKAVL